LSELYDHVLCICHVLTARYEAVYTACCQGAVKSLVSPWRCQARYVESTYLGEG